MTSNAADKKDIEDSGRPPAVVDRITVALVKQAGEDLQTLQDRTGLSKTDIVNRAISLYEFIDAQVKDGNDLLVRDQKTKEKAPDLRNRLIQRAFHKGLLVLGSGDTTLRFCPPLVVDEEQADFAVRTLEECIREAEKGI